MGDCVSGSIYCMILLSCYVYCQNRLPVFLGTRTPAVMPRTSDQFPDVFTHKPAPVYNPAVTEQLRSQSPVASAIVADRPPSITGSDRFRQTTNVPQIYNPAVNTGLFGSDAAGMSTGFALQPNMGFGRFGSPAVGTSTEFGPQLALGSDRFGPRTAAGSVGFAPQSTIGSEQFGSQAARPSLGFGQPLTLDPELFGTPRREVPRQPLTLDPELFGPPRREVPRQHLTLDPELFGPPRREVQGQESQRQRWAPAEPQWFFPSSQREWMSSCQRLGCRGRGVYCVFWGAMCPSGVRRVPCQCERGCEVDTMFIPLGQSRVVDSCNNVCSCTTVGGLASCTARRC